VNTDGFLVRLRSATLIVSLVFALVLLPGCAEDGPLQTALQKGQADQNQPTVPAPAQTQQLPGTPTQPGIRTNQATVTSASDGDTVHVKLNGRDERVRMTRVNCPEVSHPDLGIEEQPYGKGTAAYTRERLFGRRVWLELDVQRRDKYGRLFAYVWLKPPASASEREVRAKMYNAELLLRGYAQVMTVPSNLSLPRTKARGSEGNHRNLSRALATAREQRYNIPGLGLGCPLFRRDPLCPLGGCPEEPDTRGLGIRPDAACRSGSAPGHCLAAVPASSSKSFCPICSTKHAR